MSLTQVFLGLGSNIERETHLCAGLEALAGFLVDMRCSAVFESQPVGIKSGPFFNFVVSAFTDLPLMELDRRLKFIEADNGRYAPDRKGLPLDIDVLLYGEQVGNFDGLILPRAEILKNAFVLWPLSLIAPDRIHPGVGKSFAALWEEAQIDQVLAPVAFEWRGEQLTPLDLLAIRSAHPPELQTGCQPADSLYAFNTLSRSRLIASPSSGPLKPFSSNGCTATARAAAAAPRR